MAGNGDRILPEDMPENNPDYTVNAQLAIINAMSQMVELLELYHHLTVEETLSEEEQWAARSVAVQKHKHTIEDLVFAKKCVNRLADSSVNISDTNT